jgi:tetratricopeptide (TPR) repeat protein
MLAMFNLSTTLDQMSRYQEAEIFAREMVAVSELSTPVGDMHMLAAERLASVLVSQIKFEEALQVAHDAVERFSTILTDVDAMVRLLEAESLALRYLKRYHEALDIQEECFTMVDAARYPERVTATSLHSYAELLILVGGRSEEAETALKEALAKLKNKGLEFHPDTVHNMGALEDVYRQQGRKKDAKAMSKAVKKLVPQVFPKDHPGYRHYMEKL